MSIIPHRIEQESFMGLNTKLGFLSISLKFWIRIILEFVLKAHHAPKGAQCFSPITRIKAQIIV